MSDPSELERFTRWFVTPISVIRESSPTGDGAFVCLSIAFTLFERFYRIQTGTQEVDAGDSFRNAAAIDLNVNKEFFGIFWSTYRNGLLHQGSPREYPRAGTTYRYLISGDFLEYPTYFDDGGFRYICLNPWLFYDFIVSKILANPLSISGCTTYRFGDISFLPTSHTHSEVPLSAQYPMGTL